MKLRYDGSAFNSSVRRTETLMAVTLKFAPGSTIRWGAKRFVVVDYADMDSIDARELGKRRLERIPVQDATGPHSVLRRPAGSGRRAAKRHRRGSCFWEWHCH